MFIIVSKHRWDYNAIIIDEFKYLFTKLMGELVCNTMDWKERVECYHILEDNYYWEDWAYTMFDAKEIVKIGSTKIIERMLNLSKDIIQEVRTYAKNHKLELTWTHMLEQLKVLDDQITGVEKELEDIHKSGNMKNLNQVQQRSFDVKLTIIKFIK